MIISYIGLLVRSQHKNELHFQNAREFDLENGKVNKDHETRNQEFEHKEYVDEEEVMKNEMELKNSFRGMNLYPQSESINGFNIDVVKTETNSKDEEEFKEKHLCKNLNTHHKLFICS